MPRTRKPTTPTGYPAYVDGGFGLPVFRSPHAQQDAQLAAFFFDANQQQLTALCNQYLNFPTNGHTKYLPLLSKVVVLFAEMFVASRDERDSQVGRLPETEVSFWIPTMALRSVGGVFVPDHLAWFVTSSTRTLKNRPPFATRHSPLMYWASNTFRRTPPANASDCWRCGASVTPRSTNGPPSGKVGTTLKPECCPNSSRRSPPTPKIKWSKWRRC
jgi:hypothetical protein